MIPDSATSPKPLISVLVFTYNSGEVIAQCLDSLSWADEVVVFDRGSTDQTLAITQQWGATGLVHNSTNPVLQYHYALEATQGEWVLLVHPEETLSPQSAHRIQQVLSHTQEQNPSTKDTPDGFFMPVFRSWMDQTLKYGGDSPQWEVRLLRKATAQLSNIGGKPTLDINGFCQNLEAPLVRPYNSSLKAFSTQMAEQAEQRSWDLIEQGSIARHHISGITLIAHPIFQFVKRYLFKQGFRDGFLGFAYALSKAYEAFLTNLMLRSLLNKAI